MRLPTNTSAYYQKTPSSNTSNKYKLVSTKDVADFFISKGFFISDYAEATTRKPDYHGRSKHCVRLRHKSQIDDNGQVLNKQSTPEIVIFNSHNKYTSLKINIGVYRAICMNGMVLGDTYFNGKVIHTGQNLEADLNKILIDVEKKFPEIQERITVMQNKIPLENLKTQLVENAFNIRKSSKDQFLTLDDIKWNLSPQRAGDFSKDLYTITNILQERLIRGGFRYSVKNDDGSITQKSFRMTKDISLKEKINKNLFDLALAV